ncbi:lanthionine synthetase C family protein [Streptacidiphilus cavernicola]|uniref:Lanthionine synthetase C family protein n=1 Tax=Streptacidiphilus cavernicola TaxID=3342716 RepID=A0ABV6VYH1_9ACTN
MTPTTATAPTTQALSEGDLGAALLPIERGSLLAARRHLERAVEGGVSTGANASLFHGAPALEFVLTRAGQVPRSVFDATDRVVAARLASAHKRRSSGALPRPAEFDLIRGLAGLGALLLTRAAPAPLLPDVLTYLVSLAQPVQREGRDLPGWWSDAGPADEPLPGGHGNLGVAHGIAGPLAALALALRQGVHVPGQLDAVEDFASWLDRYETGYWVTPDQLTAPSPEDPQDLRPSWCYGTLGLARTRQLAALALGDDTRQQAAEDAAFAAVTDPARLATVTDASLCHGWAGLLTLVRAIADDSSEPERFTARAASLHGQLVTGLDHLPKPGFLEGRSGARLALEGADTIGWTRALLIT